MQYHVLHWGYTFLAEKGEAISVLLAELMTTMRNAPTFAHVLSRQSLLFLFTTSMFPSTSLLVAPLMVHVEVVGEVTTVPAFTFCLYRLRRD